MIVEKSKAKMQFPMEQKSLSDDFIGIGGLDDDIFRFITIGGGTILTISLLPLCHH